MNRSSKDADEIMKFMALFQRLKEWTDDAPNDLASLAIKDASIRELCDEVWVAAFEIQSNERRRRELFTAPADPKFIEAWRDYEERYEPLIPTFLDKILEDVLAGTDRPSISSTAPIGKQQPTAYREWKIADDDAQEQAKGIDGAIYWARCEVENGIVDDEDFPAQLDEGVSA